MTQGFKVCKTPKGDLFIPKYQECPKGSSASYSGELVIYFTEASGNSRDPTFTEAHVASEIVGSLNQEGRFDLSSTFGQGACSIFHPPNGHNVFSSTPKLHLTSNNPIFHLIGDTEGVFLTTDLSISDNCSIPNPLGSAFFLHSLNSGFFKSEGDANAGCELPSCSRHWHWILTLSPTGSTSNSGCLIDTDKSDDLVGTSQNDCIDGEGGNDRITGLAGNDKLNGGDGKDLLSGGAGNEGRHRC